MKKLSTKKQKAALAAANTIDEHSSDTKENVPITKKSAREKFRDFIHAVEDSKATVYVNVAIAFTALLFYLSCHTVLAFMGFYTFKALPYILGGLLILSAVASLIMMLYKKQNVLLLITLVYNIFMLIVGLGFFLGASSNIKGLMVEFGEILFIYIFAAIFIYLVFYHHKLHYKGRNVVAILLVIVFAAGSLLSLSSLGTLRVNGITEGAAVYAVGDEYQIVFRSHVKGIGWVEINGKKYYDTYAGSMRSSSKVHKITVPQQVLDEAGAYTIKTRAMVSEQGWSGLMGYTVRESYSFRAVDPTDGINFFTVTDVHDYLKPAAKAASYFGDHLDFLVMAGDMCNYLETEYDVARVLNIAHTLSGGNVPIVYARGNHELKAKAAETLNEYVGCEGENFYYTFRLKNIWGIVLDMGEDHSDDWYEFYDTALYDDYRAEQLEFTDRIIADSENEYAAPDVEYRIAVSHIPTSISPVAAPYMRDTLVALNKRLNQMDLDVMISGHIHQFSKINAGYAAGAKLTYDRDYWEKKSDKPVYIATGADYVSFVCGRRSDQQSPLKKESTYGAAFTGTAFMLSTAGNTARFINSKGEIVPSRNMFENDLYGELVSF